MADYPFVKTVREHTESLSSVDPQLQERVDRALHTELMAQAERHELDKRLKLVDAFGEDTFEDGAVLSFWKEYRRASRDVKSYRYAALKAEGMWYLAGRETIHQAYNWLQIVEFLVQGEYPTPADQVLVMEATSNASLSPKADNE